MPARTGSVHVRTLGVPSTFIRQLGQSPDMHNSPRGRWYLKLRLKMRCPAAYNAEAMVSPGLAETFRPSNVNVSVPS